MSTNYPAAADDNTTLPNPSAGSYTNNPSHLGLHGNANDAIKALEAKVGLGASTPPGSGYIFTSTSNGQSSWQPAPAAGVWGLITGTLSNQTDLQTALNAKLSLSGGTMTGNLILNADPSTALGAATKQYADGKLSLTGGTLTGSLTLAADPTTNLQAATKQYVDALGSTTLVRNETPGGSINGSNTAFTTAATFATGSLKVYLNGQRLAPGSGIDYVEVTQGFTMQYAPATGDVLLVDYETTNTTRFVQGSNSIIVNETPSGTVNGSTTLFTVLQGKYVANTLEVFINGVQQLKTTDFTETSPGSGTFTFVSAPLTGQAVRVSYQFATGASGNADTVDGIHASATATANQLMALDSNAKFSVVNITNPYKFRVYRTAAYTSPANAYGIMACDTRDFDTSSNVDITTNKGRFTAPVAGFYHFDATIVLTAATTNAQIMFIKNGTTNYFQSGQNFSNNAGFGTSGLIQLAANDYVEARYFTASAQTVATAEFAGFLVSAT